MALKIRLARIGATHNPVYRVVVAEARGKRDGRFVEILGTYSPKQRTGQRTFNAAFYFLAAERTKASTVAGANASSAP